MKIKTILMLLFLLVPYVCADGVVQVYDLIQDAWSIKAENMQVAAISYANGTERLILAVGLNKTHNERGSWIFPVPAPADKVKIGIVKDFPFINCGGSVRGKLVDSFEIAFELMGLSQIYPAYWLLRGHLGDTTTGPVNVIKHIEDYGITAELIDANSEDKLFDYLKARGVILLPEIKPIVREYIGKNYSFVVSWVTNKGKWPSFFTMKNNIEDHIAILLSFPSNKIYFPLRFSSVYSDSVIPITIFITDYVNVNLYPEIRRGTTVNYYPFVLMQINNESELFYKGASKFQWLNPEEHSLFNTFVFENGTVIKIKTKSKNFVKDLWMERKTPKTVKRISTLNHFIWLEGIITFFLLSIVASLIAGFLAFKGKMDTGTLIILGMMNLFTLAGVAIFTFTLKGKTKKEKIKYLLLFSLLFINFIYLIKIVLQSLF